MDLNPNLFKQEGNHVFVESGPFADIFKIEGAAYFQAPWHYNT